MLAVYLNICQCSGCPQIWEDFHKPPFLNITFSLSSNIMPIARRQRKEVGFSSNSSSHKFGAHDPRKFHFSWRVKPQCSAVALPSRLHQPHRLSTAGEQGFFMMGFAYLTVGMKHLYVAILFSCTQHVPRFPKPATVFLSFPLSALNKGRAVAPHVLTSNACRESSSR